MTTVTVFAGWHSPFEDIELGRDVGRMLALSGYSIAFGGGENGAMGAVARSAYQYGGEVTAITLPEWVEDTDHNYRLLITSSLATRTAELAMGDAFFVLPGGSGTLAELLYVWTCRRNGAHSRPIVVCDPRQHFRHQWEQDRANVAAGYAPPDPLTVFYDPGEAVNYLIRECPPAGRVPALVQRRAKCSQGFELSR